jgi:transglutaminase-like putative cysteine protease
MSEPVGSSGPDGGGAEYGEVALALVVVAALVVAAALLPGAGFGGAGERGAATGTPDATAGSGGERPDLSPAGTLGSGSPSGVPLSQPPERTQIGSTQGFEGELPQTPQFVVEGPTNTYWRQTAYATYTGSSWASSPRWQPISAGVPNDARTADGRAMDYRVTLLSPSSSLPTAWQPSAVRVPNGSAGVEASSVGGVRATRRLPAGTDYLTRSAAPPSDPATLRGAGTDYPTRVEERYTQLPEATPARVGAFTDELTAGAETPYDEAVLVRDWLKAKPYSLNASHEAGAPVADQFIFEMESGYCQYYATSMVVMLRTQGIPARYVVGYAPGERVGEDQFLVTADRGHAWVEVFFPDTGWVRFDPTGSGRLPVQNPQPPYDISLNRSPVAGAPVTVSVDKDGAPVVGAPVEVNDERVGWTGADGTVTTRLPYAAEFTVTARSPDAATKYDGDAGETTADRWAGGTPLPVRGRSPAPADRAAPFVAQRAAPAPNGSSRTYRSDTNVTVTVEGTPVAGGGMTVRAAIRDVPVRDATVTLDGERVGTTGPDGRLGVSLGGVSPGEHRLAVRRDSVGATTTVRVYARGSAPAADEPPPLNLSVSAPILALPGGSATVTTTRNGAPVGGARVTVDGVAAGTTTENGTLGVSLPVAGSAAVVVRGPDGASARTTVPLARNAAVAGVGVLVGLAALGRAVRRRGVTPRSAGRAATTWLSRLVAWTTGACVRAAELLSRAGRALRRGAGRLAGLPGRLVTRGLIALAVLDPRRAVGWLRRWLARLLARAGSATAADDDGGGSVDGPGVGLGTGDGDGGEGGGGASTPTLRDCWREFVRLVAPPRATTRTPGEIARYAVDRGLPAEPIRDLTDAYRDAEYGRFAPGADRLARAREALRAIREAARERGGRE